MSTSEPEIDLFENVESDDSLVSDSVDGSVWTTVSRLTGFARAAALAAILGATYLGNTFQALNSLPNLVYYQLLAGSLFASVLVPVLVRHFNDRDERRAHEVLTGFFGTTLVLAAVAAALLFVGGWVVLQLMAAGVSNAHVAAAQRHVGVLLLAMFVPQVALYVVTGVGAAAMNSKKRFALAAGAPAAENVVIVLFLVAALRIFGTDVNITTISDTETLFLGLGATLAVAAHAGLQWWGANRVGLRMVPRLAWRDPEVVLVIRKMVPALAYTAFAFLQVVAFLIAANRVEGGVVALQLGLNFFYLPLAIVAWPIARALLPQLAARKASDAPELFVNDLRRAVALATFVAIPISVAYLGLSVPLAHVVAFGKLGETGNGARLLALTVAALAPGIVAETWFILGTYASYAREDMRTPVRPMALRVGVSVALMLAALPLSGGDAFLPCLGLALSAGSLAGALWIRILVTRKLADDGMPVQHGGVSLRATISRSMAASVAMVVPAWLAARFVASVDDSKIGDVVALGLAGVICVVVFVAVQALLRSPELAWVKASMPGRRRRAVQEATP